jgi:hypothetical protein
MNPLFMVSYDLLKPGQDYTTLFAALEKLGAKRVLLSTWALRGNYTCAQLRDHLTRFIDANDRLLVCQVSDWAGRNLMSDINKV